MKIKLLVILILTLLLSGCSNIKENVYQQASVFAPQQIKIGDKIIDIELAVTPAKKAKGLSGRANISVDYGMLFIFDDYQIRTFWMKGMLAPIDIIWINDDIIVGINDNLPIPKAGEELVYYYSPAEINRVLEVAAGTARANNWQVGDRLEYINP